MDTPAPTVTISLTQFMDFLNATGAGRVNRVREIAEFDYHPRVDYWRVARKGIVAHQRGRISAKQLRDDMTNRPQPFTRRYAATFAGYSLYTPDKKWRWVDPPAANRIVLGTLGIRVNPELAYRDHLGQRKCVKLYFKAGKVTQHKLAGVLHLMARAFPSFDCHVLDVKSGRLYSRQSSKSDLDALLFGEAAAFSTIWDRLVVASAPASVPETYKRQLGDHQASDAPVTGNQVIGKRVP